jgi:hypothetical protein
VLLHGAQCPVSALQKGGRKGGGGSCKLRLSSGGPADCLRPLHCTRSMPPVQFIPIADDDGRPPATYGLNGLATHPIDCLLAHRREVDGRRSPSGSVRPHDPLGWPRGSNNCACMRTTLRNTLDEPPCIIDTEMSRQSPPLYFVGLTTPARSRIMRWARRLTSYSYMGYGDDESRHHCARGHACMCASHKGY